MLRCLRPRGRPPLHEMSGFDRSSIYASLYSQPSCQAKSAVIAASRTLPFRKCSRPHRVAACPTTDPLTVPPKWQIGEKTAHPFCGLTTTLTAEVGHVEVLASIAMNLSSGCTVQLSVVALPEPPVHENRYVRTRKGHVHRLHRSLQVRHEDGGQPVVATALTKRLRCSSQSRRGGPAATLWLFPVRCPRWSSAFRRRSLAMTQTERTRRRCTGAPQRILHRNVPVVK